MQQKMTYNNGQGQVTRCLKFGIIAPDMDLAWCSDLNSFKAAGGILKHKKR